MKKQNIILVLVVLAVLAIIIAVIFIGRGQAETPPIIIPSPSPSGGNSDIGNNGDPNTVDTDTVQSLIALLSKPDYYTRKYSVTSYWEGGEAREDITVYQKSGQYRFIRERDGKTYNTLIRDGLAYYWNSESTRVKSVGFDDEGLKYLDWYARLIAYEEVLALPAQDIIVAAYETVYDENCIYVEYMHSEELSYRLYISVDKGLLVAAQAFEDERLIYELEPEMTETTPPADDFFAIPPTT